MPSSPSIREPVCFTCGLPVGEPLRLNHLPSGQTCPTCSDRLLEALPAPFGSRVRPEPASHVERWVEVEDELDLDEIDSLVDEPSPEPPRKRGSRGPERA
jgi:hypothetical protein